MLFRSVFDGVQLGASGRQRHEGDIGGHDQFCRAVPSGLIEDQDSVCPRCDVEGDLLEVQAHRLAVAAGHDYARPLALGRADCAKDPCRRPALIFGGGWPGSTLGPAARELGLLADPCLVLPPQLYRGAAR